MDKTQISRIQSVISQLNALKLEDSSPNEIRKILNLLDKSRIIAPLFTLHKGTKIYRGRNVTSYNEVKSIKDISYKDASLCNGYGRASEPYQSAFYGIVNFDKDEDMRKSIFGCIYEISPIFRKISRPDGIYKMVIGIWEVK
mgnify:FL=1